MHFQSDKKILSHTVASVLGGVAVQLLLSVSVVFLSEIFNTNQPKKIVNLSIQIVFQNFENLFVNLEIFRKLFAK